MDSREDKERTSLQKEVLKIAEDVVRIRELLKEEHMKYRIFFNDRFMASPFQLPAMENFAEVRFR